MDLTVNKGLLLVTETAYSYKLSATLLAGLRIYTLCVLQRSKFPQKWYPGYDTKLYGEALFPEFWRA